MQSQTWKWIQKQSRLKKTIHSMSMKIILRGTFGGTGSHLHWNKSLGFKRPSYNSVQQMGNFFFFFKNAFEGHWDVWKRKTFFQVLGILRNHFDSITMKSKILEQCWSCAIGWTTGMGPARLVCFENCTVRPDPLLSLSVPHPDTDNGKETGHNIDRKGWPCCNAPNNSQMTGESSVETADSSPLTLQFAGS